MELQNNKQKLLYMIICNFYLSLNCCFSQDLPIEDPPSLGCYEIIFHHNSLKYKNSNQIDLVVSYLLENHEIRKTKMVIIETTTDSTQVNKHQLLGVKRAYKVIKEIKKKLGNGFDRDEWGYVIKEVLLPSNIPISTVCIYFLKCN